MNSTKSLEQYINFKIKKSLNESVKFNVNNGEIDEKIQLQKNELCNNCNLNFLTMKEGKNKIVSNYDADTNTKSLLFMNNGEFQVQDDEGSSLLIQAGDQIEKNNTLKINGDLGISVKKHKNNTLQISNNIVSGNDYINVLNQNNSLTINLNQQKLLDNITIHGDQEFIETEYKDGEFYIKLNKENIIKELSQQVHSEPEVQEEEVQTEVQIEPEVEEVEQEVQTEVQTEVQIEVQEEVQPEPEVEPEVNKGELLNGESIQMYKTEDGKEVLKMNEALVYQNRSSKVVDYSELDNQIKYELGYGVGDLKKFHCDNREDFQYGDFVVLDKESEGLRVKRYSNSDDCVSKIYGVVVKNVGLDNVEKSIFVLTKGVCVLSVLLNKNINQGSVLIGDMSSKTNKLGVESLDYIANKKSSNKFYNQIGNALSNVYQIGNKNYILTEFNNQLIRI